MPLVTTTEMFKKAYDGGYAIGAFNVNNMEIVQGITEAAKEVNAPLRRLTPEERQYFITLKDQNLGLARISNLIRNRDPACRR